MNKKEKLKKYKYTAIDLDNKKSTGIILAENDNDLKKILIEARLYLVSFKVIKDKEPLIEFITKVKPSELMYFTRELSDMISSGVSIIDALDTMRGLKYSRTFTKVLNTISNDIRSGLLLSEALGKHKNVFSEMYINMTRVGELSGSLELILKDLADYYENDFKVRNSVKSAMIYPTILIILTVVVLLVLVIAIIPIFKTTLIKLDVDLPPLTIAILNFSDFIINNYSYIIIAGIFIIICIYFLLKIEKIKYVLDTIKAKAPFIKTITQSLVSSSFVRGFSTLLSGGVDLMKSIEITGNIIENRYYKNKLNKAYLEIQEGQSIAATFRKYNVFPETLIQIITVGEQTGSLDKVLSNSVEKFDEKLKLSSSRVTALLEPILICLMGGMIALIMLSVFAPLLSIITSIGG